MMMIALSDNLCTNLIIARAGIQRLAETIRGPLGLHGTELNRKLMDAEARQRGLENWTTPQDCIHLYDLIANLPDQDRALVELMLLANQDDALLKRNLPRDTVDFYHKTGSLTGVLHDWGYTRNCQLFLLTNNVQAEPAMFSIFGQVGAWLLE